MMIRFPRVRALLVRSRIHFLLLTILGISLGTFAVTVPTLAANRFSIDTTATAASLASNFGRTTAVGGLTNPTQMRFAPNGDMYIAEQCGKILLDHNGTLSTVITVPNVTCHWEEGLLSIALDGNFASNGYIYAAYTYTESACNNMYSVLARFTVVNGVASTSSEKIIFDFYGPKNPTPNASWGCSKYPAAIYHNINDVEWGPDNKLWVATADRYTCGTACGPEAQDMNSPSGKLLRINPDGSAPTDNPFYGTGTNAQDYIWALGFRSNFRFTFMANGTPMVGDVGVHTATEDKWQKFYMVQKGGNYGWSSFEYHQPCTSPPQANLSNCPYYEYQNNPVGSNAITGFAQYESTAYPSVYRGGMFYSEYGTETVHFLTFTDNTYTHVASDFLFDSGAGYTVDLQIGPDGDLYSTNFGCTEASTNNCSSGAIYKYTYSGPTNPPPPSSPLQINNLVVLDSANAGNWSIQGNLHTGDNQFGDRSYTISSLPSVLNGAAWIRTANSSHSYTGNPTAHFYINDAATVYVSIDNRLSKPSWMDSSWINTGLTMTNTEKSPPYIQTLYARHFDAGTVQLGPVTSGGTSALMYTVAVVPSSAPPPPPTSLVSNLAVQDSANASNWSIQSNLQTGNTQYGDQSTTLTSVPSSLAGSAWIRTAAASNAYTGNPVATFNVNAEATVYVALDATETSPPSWIDSTWTNTGLTMTNSASGNFTLYAKTFLPGTVSLGPVTASSNNMYTVIVVPGAISGSPVQLGNLAVSDSANGGNWSLQTNLGSGDVQYGDRGYTLVSVPSSLQGMTWIRTANSSKAYTGNPIVTFTIGQPAIVYVAVDTRLSEPSWMGSSWSATGLTMTDNQGSGANTFALFGKVFPAGSVSLGPNDSGGNDNMYTVIVYGQGTGGGPPPPTPTPSPPTPTPTPGGSLQLGNLVVNDSANAGNWSLQQSGFGSGVVQYGDRGYTISSMPGGLSGAAWVRTANTSKAYTGTTLVTFSINESATVYIALDTRDAVPSWLSSGNGWTKTSMTMTNNEASGQNTFVLYSKSFGASTVTLGPNDNGATLVNMYTVIVVP